MDLTKVLERLADFPEHSIGFYGRKGQVERKPYPAITLDVQCAIEQLRRWGVERGRRVGLLASNCYEFIVYDLALLQLGCTSLVFPEEFGNQTSRQIIEHYRLNLLLLSKNDVWPALTRGQWTAYIDAENPPDTHTRQFPGEQADAEYTPAIVFSSGSSGKIKGMAVNPRGVEDTVVKFHRLFEVSASDSLLVFLPLTSFQQRIMVYAAFFYGFDVFVVKPAQLFSAFKDFKPTLCLAPPLFYQTIHNQFTRAINALSLPRRKLIQSLAALAKLAPTGTLRKRLRRIVYGNIYSTLGGRIRLMWTGMAPIRRSTLDFFAAAHIPLFEAYGLTECGVIASNSPSHNRIGSVGKPVEENSVRLADDGEILIRQQHLPTTRYIYYEDGDGTQTYLDAHTIATGDIGRFDEDGYLYLLGRKKEHIVTAQGYKVHPELLEAQINICDGVEHSVVFGNALPHLVALVSLQDSQGPLVRQRIEGQIAELNQNLPPVGRIQKVHFTSKQFTVENGFLTRNLKLNRSVLFTCFESELFGNGRAAEVISARSRVAPQTETERVLAEIWKDILKVESVDRSARFIGLGGDSLLATQVLSRIHDAFHVDLPIGSFLEAETLADVAGAIDRFTATHDDDQKMQRIERASRDRELPLSYAQQRLWFLRELEPDDASYNEISAVRLCGSLDRQALEQAFLEIIARHEILRTTFETVDGQPFQVINPNSPLNILSVDLSHLRPDEQDAELRRLATEMARKPIDLTRLPLMRISLIRCGPSEHVLLLMVHHIISDGWSQGIIVREVASVYRSLVEGSPAKLPDLPLQYADFAVWQRQWLHGETLGTLLQYWKEQLADAPPLLELSTDRPHSLDMDHSGGVVSFIVDPNVTERLKTICREENVTLFMLLLAAFQVQLCRYTGQDDIVVGTPIANRKRAEIEPLVGFFVNTLVLRTKLSGDPSFRHLLHRVRKVTLGAYEHQDLPFEKLVEELQPDRRLTRTPLFQVMFILQNAPADALELPGLKVTQLQLEPVATKFDLTLSFHQTVDGLKGTFIYDTGLFDAATVKRMAEHCRTLLAGLAADPDRRLSTLPLLDPAEHRLLIHEWNNTQVEYGPPRCIHELFEEQVRLWQQHTAVVDEVKRLNYDQLNARANRLARRLQRLGVGPETRVGVLLERSVEAMVAVLGVLKAGGAFVALEPMHPVDRWCRILTDAGVAVVISVERLANRLPADAVRLVVLDLDAESLADENADNLACTATPENLAYVVYTSGSTGQPKGVGVEHRQVFNYLRGIERNLALRPAASYAAVSTLAADLGHTVVFGALCVGGGATLHMISQECAGDAKALDAYLARYDIDYLKIVPSHIGSLLEAGGDVIPQTGVILGGEALTRELSETIEAAAPRVTIFNHYGPTETTVGVLTHRVKQSGPLTRSGMVPLGRPLGNIRAYVLDRRLEPVPVGVAGELYIGGAGVSRGYLNRPETTAEKFIPDLFLTSEPGGRLYRTGDVVRYLPDGNIEFLGRSDEQVKIRGYRIEPAEIAETLRQHQAVREAIVIAYERNTGDKSLAAYMTTSRGALLTLSELRDFARERLPEFMVPAAWTIIDEIPLTPNGKIDRSALPAPEQVRQQSENAYVAPRSLTEEIVAGLWAGLLRVDRVGVSDNFFNLGGHSLLATQLVSHLRRELQIELPLRAIFEEPTVAGQAERIEALRWASQEFQVVAHGAEGDREIGEL